jgi:hypothetical protein
MCNINIPFARSFFNYEKPGVPVGCVTFTRSEICKITVISVDYLYNLLSICILRSYVYE